MKIPRMLIDGVRAVVKKDSYPIPPIFTKLAKEGNVDEHAMYNTYNMGIGMIVAVDPADVDKTMEAIKATGDTPYVIGHIEERRKRSYIMLNVVVLVSGGGTNLQAIIDAVENGTITNTKIAGVISNNKNAYALERAEKTWNSKSCISPKDYANRATFNQKFMKNDR